MSVWVVGTFSIISIAPLEMFTVAVSVVTLNAILISIGTDVRTEMVCGVAEKPGADADS
jgi:hypothetical protein